MGVQGGKRQIAVTVEFYIFKVKSWHGKIELEMGIQDRSKTGGGHCRVLHL